LRKTSSEGFQAAVIEYRTKARESRRTEDPLTKRKQGIVQRPTTGQEKYRSSVSTPGQEAARRESRAALKQIACLHCAEHYTDWAVDWSEAWVEGNMDSEDEMGVSSRDCPTKIKCELCGLRAWISPFGGTPKSAERNASF
jgi:hypothetical protein